MNNIIKNYLKNINLSYFKKFVYFIFIFASNHFQDISKMYCKKDDVHVPKIISFM